MRNREAKQRFKEKRGKKKKDILLWVKSMQSAQTFQVRARQKTSVCVHTIVNPLDIYLFSYLLFLLHTSLCSYACIQSYIPYIHASLQSCIHTFIHSYIHISLRWHIHTSLHSYIYISLKSHIHTLIHSYRYPYNDAFLRLY